MPVLEHSRHAFEVLEYERMKEVVSSYAASILGRRLAGALAPSGDVERIRIGARTNVAKPLHDLAAAVRKRGMVVLISDLLDDPASVLDGLKHFRYRGTDVIVFHILDPYELQFPFEQAARFRDMETEEEVAAVPGSVGDEYRQNMQDLIAFYRRELGLAGIDYCLLETSKPLELGLMSYLMTRRKVL